MSNDMDDMDAIEFEGDGFGFGLNPPMPQNNVVQENSQQKKLNSLKEMKFDDDQIEFDESFKDVNQKNSDQNNNSGNSKQSLGEQPQDLHLIKKGTFKSEEQKFEKGSSILSEPKQGEQELKIKKKSPSQCEDSKGNQLEAPQVSQIIKAHSYKSNSNSNGGQQIDSKAVKEESKENGDKVINSVDSYLQHPSSLNTQNLQSKFDDTNSKSNQSRNHQSHIGSNIGEPLQINNIQKLLQVLGQLNQNGDGGSNVQVQLRSNGQTINIDVNPDQLLQNVENKSSSKASDHLNLENLGNKSSGREKVEEKQNSEKDEKDDKEIKNKSNKFQQSANKFDFAKFTAKVQKDQENDDQPEIKTEIIETSQANPEQINLFFQDLQEHNDMPVAKPLLQNLKLNNSVNNFGDVEYEEAMIPPINIHQQTIKEESHTFTNSSGQNAPEAEQKVSRIGQLNMNNPPRMIQANSVYPQNNLFAEIEQPRPMHHRQSLHQNNDKIRMGFQVPSIVATDTSNQVSMPSSIEKDSITMSKNRSEIFNYQVQSMQPQYEDEHNMMQEYRYLKKKPPHMMTSNEKEKLIYIQEILMQQKGEEFNKLKVFLKQKFFKDQDDDQLREEMQRLDMFYNSKLHLAFLFASPLVNEYKNENNEKCYKDITHVDHYKEFQYMRDGLKKIDHNIKYRKICATFQNFQSILCEKPQCLHFSGHGVKNIGGNFTQCGGIKSQGDMLVFEDNDLKALYFSEEDLRNELQTQEIELQLVVLASCYSENAGRIFHRAGVKHVICIREKEKILDDAQIKFSEKFYFFMFSQQESICQAFNLAINSIKSDPILSDEAFKFIMLRDSDIDKVDQHLMYQDQLKGLKKHICQPMGPYNKGQVEDLGLHKKPLYNLQGSQMSKLTDIYGRSEDQFRIITNLNHNRLVSITGIPGIGKTSIAKSVALVLEERERFADGCIYISMQSRYQANMLISQMLRYIKLQESSDVLQKLNKMNQKFKQRQYDLVNQKDDLDIDSQINSINEQDLEKIIQCIQSKSLLILIDNIEDPINNDEKNLKFILQTLLDRCQNIKILTTTRTLLNKVGNIDEWSHNIQALSPYWSVQLFLEKADFKDVDDHNIDKKIGQINELLNMQDGIEQQVNLTGNKYNDIIRRLQVHPLFKQLSGHPYTISLIAPMAKDYTLVQLYHLINSKTFEASFGQSSHPLNQLKNIIESSVRHLLQKNPRAIDLFCLIGSFPGGVTEECLVQLWGEDWFGYVTELKNMSLVQKKEIEKNEQITRYSLLPFMNYYAQQVRTIDPYKQHLSICQYFIKMMIDFYNIIDVEAQRDAQEKMRIKLNLNETNIWATIERIKDFNSDKQSEFIKQHDQEEKINQKAMNRQQQRIDKQDYILTLEGLIPEVLPDQLVIQQLPLLKRKRSNSVAEISPKLREKLDDQNQKSSIKKKQSNSHGKQSDNNSMLNQDQNQSSKDKYSINNNEIIKLGELEQSKRSRKLAKKKKTIVDMGFEQLFQTQYDSDSSFVDNQPFKFNQKCSPENITDTKIYPSKQQAEYMSECEDATLQPRNKKLKDENKQKYQFIIEEEKQQTGQKQYENLQNDFGISMGIVKSDQINNLRRPSQITATSLMQLIPRERSNSDVLGEQRPSISDKKSSQNQTTDNKKSNDEVSVEQDSKLKHPTKLQQKYLQVPEKQDKVTKNRREQTMQNINKKKNEQPNNEKKKKPRPGDVFNKWKKLQHLEFPIEGKLLIMFTTNLILNQYYDQAIRVMTQIGIGCYFKGPMGKCNKANSQKLLAIAYFQQNHNFKNIEKLLDKAGQKFNELQIFHGQASIGLAKAQFFSQKTQEFVDDRDEDQILELALEEIKIAIKYYSRINHRIGHAHCLQIQNQINKKLNIQLDDQKKINMQMTDLKRQENLKEKVGQSKFIQRSNGTMISLLVEQSNEQWLQPTKERKNVQLKDPVDNSPQKGTTSSSLKKPLPKISPRTESKGLVNQVISSGEDLKTSSTKKESQDLSLSASRNSKDKIKPPLRQRKFTGSVDSRRHDDNEEEEENLTQFLKNQKVGGIKNRLQDMVQVMSDSDMSDQSGFLNFQPNFGEIQQDQNNIAVEEQKQTNDLRSQADLVQMIEKFHPKLDNSEKDSISQGGYDLESNLSNTISNDLQSQTFFQQSRSPKASQDKKIDDKNEQFSGIEDDSQKELFCNFEQNTFSDGIDGISENQSLLKQSQNNPQDFTVEEEKQQSIIDVELVNRIIKADKKRNNNEEKQKRRKSSIVQMDQKYDLLEDSSATSTDGKESSSTPSYKQQDPEEVIEVDIKNLSDQEQQIINTLYSMYKSETNEAEKQNYKDQINQYLKAQQIPHKLEDKSQNIQRNNQINMAPDIPMSQKYYNTKSIQPLAGQSSKQASGQIQQQLRRNQRMNLQTARKKILYQPVEQIIEENYDSDSSEGVMIASNIANNIDNIQARSQYRHYEEQIEKKSQKSSFSNKQQKQEPFRKESKSKLQKNQSNWPGNIYKQQSLDKKTTFDEKRGEAEQQEKKEIKKTTKNVISKLSEYFSGAIKKPVEESKQEEKLGDTSKSKQNSSGIQTPSIIKNTKEEKITKKWKK